MKATVPVLIRAPQKLAQQLRKVAGPKHGAINATAVRALDVGLREIARKR